MKDEQAFLRPNWNGNLVGVKLNLDDAQWNLHLMVNQVVLHFKDFC